MKKRYSKQDFKLINKMALPALAGSIVETVFSIADQAIIGRMSVEGYAAVGVSANILYLLTGTIGILSLAFYLEKLSELKIKKNQKKYLVLQ